MSEAGEAISGVLVVGHGSRRQEANDDVRQVARLIGERGNFPLVRAAFLELEHPTIAEGFAELVADGARDVTVHPYFLSPGRHTRGDVPREVHEAAAAHPHVTYRISEPLTAHPLVIAASVERIRQARAADGATEEPRSAQRGRVYLVGAGPGDPGLLTVRARDLLAGCDAVVYDYLVNPEILQHAPAGVERIYVGKVGGGQQTPQHEINDLLVGLARENRQVVRLKGGDPFVFGRGAEEAEALRAAGVEFEVVPGVSSAVAVPAYAGIPLTHRTHSSSFAVVTGTRAAEDEDLFAAPAADTLVILMGVTHLRQIAEQLIGAGRPARTPAAVIRWGTYEGQQIVTGDLGDIARRAEEADLLRAPAIIVVGEVVRLRERLAWFGRDRELIPREETADAAAVIS